MEGASKQHDFGAAYLVVPYPNLEEVVMYRIRMTEFSGWTTHPEEFETIVAAKATIEKIVKDGGFWESDRKFLVVGTSLTIVEDRKEVAQS